MASERNALAELAESLRFVTVSRAVGGHAEEYDIREYKRISDALVKASRIIVELAKVKWWRSVSGWIPRGSDVSKILVTCRAIAEEGEEHDK